MAEEEQQYIKPEEANGDHQTDNIPEQNEAPLEGGGGGEPKDADTSAPPREDVCRDFLKNICNRGSRCKFYHPPESKARVEEHINFCIDFQVRFAAIVPFVSFGSILLQVP